MQNQEPASMDSLPSSDLQKLRGECGDVLKAVCDRIVTDRQLANRLRSLIASPDLLADFTELAKSEPESAAVILQASIASLANVQTVVLDVHHAGGRGPIRWVRAHGPLAQRSIVSESAGQGPRHRLDRCCRSRQASCDRRALGRLHHRVLCSGTQLGIETSPTPPSHTAELVVQATNSAPSSPKFR